MPATAATTSPSQANLSDGFSSSSTANHNTASMQSHCKEYPRPLTENSMNVGKAATQAAATIPATEPYSARVTSHAARITRQPAINAGNRNAKTVLPNKCVLKCTSKVFNK